MVLSPVDKFILENLSQGLTQKEISERMQIYGFSPCSLSTIEKQLYALRKEFGAKTSFHLAVIVTKRKLLK